MDCTGNIKRIMTGLKNNQMTRRVFTEEQLQAARRLPDRENFRQIYKQRSKEFEQTYYVNLFCKTAAYTHSANDAPLKQFVKSVQRFEKGRPDGGTSAGANRKRKK